MMTDDKNSAGSGSYVLNAMDENERIDFEQQLAESEELRNEVTELTDTAVLLGMAADPVTPSPALKQNIMARLSQTPQFQREADAARPALRAVPALVEEPLQSAPAEVLTRATQKAQARWYSRPVVMLTAAAAAVVLIVGGVLSANVAIQGSNTSQQADALAAITTASDVQRSAVPVSTGGTATLVWSLHLRKSALIGKGLAVLPSGKTYELWYISPVGEATGAGLFESNGKSTLKVLSGHMKAGDKVGVTVEPDGGSKAPTTKPVVVVSA
jgi:anti-sigma-K factor RskA